MVYAGAGNYETGVPAHYRCGGICWFISLQETFLLDDKEKTMEGDGYVINVKYIFIFIFIYFFYTILFNMFWAYLNLLKVIFIYLVCLKDFVN
jgi:hypothetical protein